MRLIGERRRRVERMVRERLPYCESVRATSWNDSETRLRRLGDEGSFLVTRNKNCEDPGVDAFEQMTILPLELRKRVRLEGCRL
jgi:hypothetical protein